MKTLTGLTPLRVNPLAKGPRPHGTVGAFLADARFYRRKLGVRKERPYIRLEVAA